MNVGFLIGSLESRRVWLSNSSTILVIDCNLCPHIQGWWMVLRETTERGAGHPGGLNAAF